MSCLDVFAFVVWEVLIKNGYALGPSHVMVIDVPKFIMLLYLTLIQSSKERPEA